MNRDSLLKFKAMFEAQKQSLVYSSSLINAEFQLNTDDMMDEVDLCSSEMEQGMRMRLRNRETLYAKKIDQALAKIHNGTFGECTDCGDDIELKRLEARPTATHCISCKEMSERLEQVHIDGHRTKSLGAMA